MPHPFRSSHRPLAASVCLMLIVATAALAGTGCKKKSSPVAPTPQPPEKLVDTNNAPASTANMDARTSMRTPANSGTITFDDFVSAEGVVITGLTWQGIYCKVVENAPPSSPVATGFQIGFYPDAANNPNNVAPLVSTVYPIARVAETLEQTRTGICTPVSTSIAVYKYHVTLDTPFTAAPGVRYWLGIQAQVDELQANNPDFVFWGWRNGTSYNNRSVQINAAGSRTEYSTDRAFSIER